MSTITFRRDPTREFRTWHISEIYVGEEGSTTEHLYVPNVSDLVYDGQSSLFKVTAVDDITAIPTLERINPGDAFFDPITDPNNLSDGLRWYQPHGTNRAFVDNSRSPAIVSIDARYRIFGSEATEAKLFLGSDTGDSGTVISQTIDSNNVVVSEMIKLEPLFDSNNTIHRPARFHTTMNLSDGELVTLVIYNAAGYVSGEHPFIIRNANAISGPAASDIYIEDIELISDLISPTDTLLIENPLNVPFTTTLLMCKVHYSNGTSTLHSIDGNKVKLHGLNNFNTSILGPVTQLVLTYYTDPDEPAINLQGTVKPSLSKIYKLANTTRVDNWAVKLYVIPVWSNGVYNLRYRLTNLDYNAYIDVTDQVTTTQLDGTPFLSGLFNNQQNLIATINLDNASVANPGTSIHVQQYGINLAPPGPASVDEWVIDYGGDGLSVYGVGHHVRAALVGNKKFRVDAGITSETSWIEWLYMSLDPIFDREILNAPPQPTHFRIEHAGQPIGTYPVSQWDTEFELGLTRDWVQGEPLVLIWLSIVNGVESTLGVSPLAIKYTYS